MLRRQLGDHVAMRNTVGCYQSRLPPIWYSVTCVSKGFSCLFRLTYSDIHGNGLSVPYCSGKSSRPRRRSAMCSTYSANCSVPMPSISSGHAS